MSTRTEWPELVAKNPEKARRLIAAAVKSTSTTAEAAAKLGLERTQLWRYMVRLKSERKTCPTCKGKGEIIVGARS